MFALIATALALQVSVTVTKTDSTAADSLRRGKRSVSIGISTSGARDSSAKRRAPRRQPVTPELLRTAFHDQQARDLLARARVARLEQDSSILAYDAMAYRRISAGLGFKKIGRDRLLFRHETASRVRWQRNRGAWVDVVGLRTTIPVLGRRGSKEAEKEAKSEMDDVPAPIPYYPGREALFVGTGLARMEVDEREFVHPLATGAEAYYKYAIGDSVGFELPDGTRIGIRELRVEARRPQWNLIVGSFWFDVATAQLVRAVYRQSVPLDIVMLVEEEKKEEGGKDDDDIPRWLRPMTANIKVITVEYGLIRGEDGGYWWLPRIQAAEGDAQVSFMRVPFALEESFKYATINGRDSLPATPLALLVDSAESVSDSVPPSDSTLTDTLVEHGDSTKGHKKRVLSRQYDDGDATLHRSSQYEGTLQVVTRLPKDSVALAHSSELPPSPYDANEEVFGESQREELEKELRGLYPGMSPTRPTLHYGLERGLLRYNRVEGLSAGAAAEQAFGSGYTADAMLRLGVADWEPNGELSFRRSDGARTLQVGVFRRLAVANDWVGGDPLSVGGSLSALLFGRDEGFYFRSLGAELTGTVSAGGGLTWRLFAERHSDAERETNFSLPHVFNGLRFNENINADNGEFFGAEARARGSWGLDPHGWRALADARVEGASGEGRLDFGRGSLELTVSHGLGPYLDGALTGGAGTSGGIVPAQRLWYLGGTQSIRGQPAGTVVGNAYWMGRAELGSSFILARPTLFFDLGWAGQREDWSEPGRPISGAGVGASFMDGLIRFDIAKGIRPTNGWRADLYVEARF